MKPHPLLILALVGALLGFVFASFSTYDFAQHLDRQVHSVHCSFVPGLAEEEPGGSDCEVTLMSRYSSVMRTTVWGGIPISLPAMSVFAFLLFFGVDLLLGRRQRDSRATGFYALATLLPVFASVIMAFISLGELDAACKLCIGIYASSALTFISAVGLWVRALFGLNVAPSSSWSDALEEEEEWTMGGADEEGAPHDTLVDEEPFDPSAGEQPPTGWATLVGMFGLGIVFVAVPVLVYAGMAPDHSEFIGECGTMDEAPDAELLVPMGPQTGVRSIEVFDPLCPACRGFEEHLAQTRFHDELARKAVMFPLDSECNWMLDDPVHPGACAISEAVLCADDPDEVVDWAFENQEKIRSVAERTPDSAREMVSEQFPELADCVGSPKAKQKLNRSLRWAVDNELRVLTPQLYIDGVRLCDEDVDLGLEFALDEMLRRHDAGTLKPTRDEGGDQ